jgi:Arc/MetJ family transcription regulator
MRTNIEIDGQLMARAQKLTNIKSKKILVDNALRLYVTVENQKKLLELWGKVEIDDKAFE